MNCAPNNFTCPVLHPGTSFLPDSKIFGADAPSFQEWFSWKPLKRVECTLHVGAHDSLVASRRTVVDKFQCAPHPAHDSHLWYSHLCVTPSLGVWAGPVTCFKPIDDGKGDGMSPPWLCYIICLASRLALSLSYWESFGEVSYHDYYSYKKLDASKNMSRNMRTSSDQHPDCSLVRS